MEAAADSYHRVTHQAQRDELILSHLALVRHAIGKLTGHLPPGADLENLTSAGMLGLVEAATNFDPRRGVPFKNYAYPRIRGAVYDELRRNCPLPQHLLGLVAKIRAAYRSLPPPVTIGQLTAATGLTSDEVTDCLAALRMTRMNTWSGLSRLLSAELEDHHPLPEVEVELEEQRLRLTQAITALPERERVVVTLYYLEDLRLKEIGTVLGLSESRVSRVLNNALFALEEQLRAEDERKSDG